MARRLTVEVERFPIAGKFTIARGSRTEIVVVTATIADSTAVGRGECVPYARYGESVESVAALIESVRGPLEAGLDRVGLQDALPPGAARNALDCALWDLDAKLTGVPAHVTAGTDRLPPVTTAYTISLDEPAAMADAARRAEARPILKIKLGAPDGDLSRIAAVRRAVPEATLIADANEGWRAGNVADHLKACADHGYSLIEQPLPAADDAILAELPHDVLLCADESLHDRHGLEALVGRYDAINIKLDKAGGLTEALALATKAQDLGFSLMIGCMLGTSLAMAPALLLAPRARFVDLDGPLLLAREREGGLRYEGSVVYPPSPALWG
jgi:L-alanine-DL-glutamate epimerase-like enolase superfamily enzyme